MPEFDSVDAARELIGALVMGLWNRLSRHQDRNSPFRLMRTDSAPTREGLASFALMRRQELDGFIDGLFGREEVVDLPERASRGLDVLSGMRAIFAAALHTARDETKAETDKDRETKLQHMREMTKNAEREMHAIVLSCKRARKRLLSAWPSKKPRFH